MKALLSLLLLLLVSFQINAEVLTLSTKVHGTEDKTCKVYLKGQSELKELPIVLFLGGTGVYSNGDFAEENPLAQVLVDQSKALVISVDKPGIEYSQLAKDHFIINDALYNRYTQEDLINCSNEAIKWASSLTQSSFKSDIFLVGHSEGSQVITRLYQSFLKNDLTMAKRVRGLYLSGVIMKNWKEIINYQIQDPKENIDFWQAIAEKNDTKLRKIAGLPYAYWEQILKTESNEDTLKSLASQNSKVIFQVYLGLNDENTLAKPVLEFEAWNLQRHTQGQSALRFYTRYYQADHWLNSTALNDMIFSMMAYLTP